MGIENGKQEKRRISPAEMFLPNDETQPSSLRSNGGALSQALWQLRRLRQGAGRAGSCGPRAGGQGAGGRGIIHRKCNRIHSEPFGTHIVFYALNQPGARPIHNLPVRLGERLLLRIVRANLSLTLIRCTPVRRHEDKVASTKLEDAVHVAEWKGPPPVSDIRATNHQSCPSLLRL